MKKLIPIVLLLIIIGGIYAYFQYNKPHRNIAEEKADYTLTANQLFDAFDQNENEANELYLDNVITVTGKIVDLDTNLDDKGVVTLGADKAMIGGVMCTLKETDPNLDFDMEVTLKCRCTGFLTDVILIDCNVEK